MEVTQADVRALLECGWRVTGEGIVCTRGPAQSHRTIMLERGDEELMLMRHNGDAWRVIRGTWPGGR